jgi:hypothetical protein
MSLFSSLENPLERLSVLPDAMNWRGVWNNTTQYFRNDVVLSPLDTATYIALKVSVIGGADPSVNLADWLVLAPATAGVIGVSAGPGIAIGGTPTLPVISNTGVLTAVAGTGITNTQTATDPRFENTGVLSLNVAAPGLSSTGGQNPTITNTGVLSVVGGAGVQVTGTNIPTIINTGVLGLSATAPGLTLTPNPTPNIPLITNTGVVSIAGGPGIVVGGSPSTPTITLAATSSPPIMSLITSVSLPGTIAPASTGASVLFPSGTSQIALDLLNGVGDPNGTWVLDLTGFTFFVDAPAGGTNTITLAIEDTTTGGGPYTYTGVPGTGVVSVDVTRPLYLSLGKFYLDVATCRATGFRVLSQLLISNDSGASITWTGFGAVPCYYYPNGIQ